ncbi:MAG TPA: CARDB domain-containing protein [Terriglobales bacterium]|nr:CARDB domain-containing protein [Terriglobales bacterium]
MRTLRAILVFFFFLSVIFMSYSSTEATGSDSQRFSSEKTRIEVKVMTESDLMFLKGIGLDCSNLGRCICQADSTQLLTLAKERYQFRPIKESHQTEQQGIRQSQIFQVKLQINTQEQLSIINNLGLNCAGTGECVIEVNREQMRKLKQNGISFTGIKEGIRVEGTSLAFKPEGATYGRNDYAYYVPYSTWTYSPITIDNAPYGATVKEVEASYLIYDLDGQIHTIRVDLDNENLTKELTLWNFEGYGYSISETEKDSIIFWGEPVNQTWKLYVWDNSDPGRSIIYPWSITLWFSGPPAYMANSSDYTIPDGQDSVCSAITINTAPAIAKVSSIDVQYDIIHPYTSDLYVWLTDVHHSAKSVLWSHYSGTDIHETVTDITDFNGESVNQIWQLWALDYATQDIGYIDFWSITIWYLDLPDLVIQRITPSKTNPIKGEYITVDMVLKNQGTTQSPMASVGLYNDLLSPPNTSTPRSQIGSCPALFVGDSATVTFNWVSSADTDTWDMYGLADCNGFIQEINESNNYIGPRRVKWYDITPLPDLVIEEAWVSNSCNPTQDESVYVDVVIKNVGGAAAPMVFYTGIFYNITTPPDISTPEDDWHPTIGRLGAGQIDTFSFVLPNPSSAETWTTWLLVDCDDNANEINENNNLFGPIYIYWQGSALRRGSITRGDIIANALKFVNVNWVCPAINGVPRSCNIGTDTAWTSDYTVGMQYQGEPYKWGGWDIPGDLSNPECFLYYVTNNLKRAGSHKENDCIPGDGGNPSWATGTDCSGLVSRAWDVFYVGPSGKRFKPGVYTLIDSFAVALANYDSLKRGDALISTKKQHTFIFKDWIYPDTMEVIEARSFGLGLNRGQSRVKLYKDWTRAKLINDEYNPYKYKEVQEETSVIPGDANSDGTVSTSDIVYLVNYLFKGGPPPNPMCKADVNHDHRVNIADVVYLVSYLFKGGPPPSPDACA